MDKKNTTVIICCAGMGTRLGIGTNKSLININGQPLITYLLKLVDDFDDARVVVGYCAEEIIKIVNKHRKDVLFAFNNEFKSTGPAESLKKALISARENILIIDGDLLISPRDFSRFLTQNEESIGYQKITSSEPIKVEVNRNKVTNFNIEESEFEWIGIAYIKKDNLTLNKEYIYELIEKLTPINGVEVSCVDIDTPEDYERAINFINNNYEK